MEKQETETNQEVAQQPQALNLIEQAKAIRDEIRAENDRRETLLKQEQEMHAVQMLSGHASAGQQATEKTPEQIKKENAQAFFKGSMIEKAIEKYG